MKYKHTTLTKVFDEISFNAKAIAERLASQVQ